MQNTTNYDLKKPEFTDISTIEDINDNMDSLDTLIKAINNALLNVVIAAGKSGGQTINGGTGPSENLILNPTSHATKGMVVVGTIASPASNDPTMQIGRAIGAEKSGNAHGVVDGSTINRTGTVAYASFDAMPTFSGAQNYDHYVSYQSRPIFYGSGVISYLQGFTWIPVVLDGSVTNVVAYYVNNVALSGDSVATNQYGLYICPLSGATNNFAIYSEGSSTKSHHAGRIGIGKETAPTQLLHLADDTLCGVQIDSYAASPDPFLMFRAALGTRASPAAITTGKEILWIGGKGFGATVFPSASKVAIAAFAAENWSDSAQGTYISFHTTVIGGTTRSEKMRISDKGYVGLGIISPSVGLELANAATSGKIIAYDLYAYNNVSALSFTDRTEAFIGNALNEIKKIKSDLNNKIDHVSLPEFVVDAYQDENGEWWPGRNLGNMISILTKGMQELISIIDEKDAKILDLETRLKRIEDMILK